MSQFSMDSLGWVAKTPVLVSSLHRAQAYAAQQQHRQLNLDHLLLALTEDADALVVLHASNIDIERLRSAVSDIVGRNEDRDTVPDLAGPAASSELTTIFEYASAAADQSGRGMIDGAIVLAALIGEGNSSAARLLETHGLTFEHAIASLQNRASTPPSEPLPPTTQAPQTQAPVPQAPVPQAPVTQAPVTQAPVPQAAVPQAPMPEVQVQQKSRPAPAATVPPPVQPVSSDTPPSFGHGGETRLPPASPPARDLAPRTARQGINEHTGAAVQSPQPEFNGAPPPPPAPPVNRRAPEPVPGSSANGAPYTQAPPARLPNGAPQTAPQAARSGDAMIAPWPDPETAAPPPPPPPRPVPATSPAPGRQRPNQPGQTSAAVQPRTTPNAVVEEGQLIENIPRKMRVGVSEQIEVRIARNSVQVPVNDMQGGGTPQGHNLYVTKAMTVRLRAPEGGIRIETSSPETQWIDNALGLIHDDFASWRWTVTPDLRGTRKLQLVVSARTVGSDGVAAETALPDQVFDVVVRMNYARTAVRLGGWAIAAAAGGAITAFGEEAYKKVIELANLI